MANFRNSFSRACLGTALLVVVFALPGCRHKKYENPITKDTQQPDKVLFDKSVKDIEKGRYEIARITLNTLINTYDTSEYLAKAKLAIADSWYREGGAHGLAQAEAEYKDFILFYPTMEEAAESQDRICDIHYRQMEKPDRDAQQALRAEMECRTLIQQFPNSKFAPIAQQKLRNIQEAIAEGEARVGKYYQHKGSHPAAANRLKGLVDQYPLYSGADEALWLQADSYSRMGNRFRKDAGEALQKLVREYPMSSYLDAAKKKLKEMEMTVPEPDPAAVARAKYEQENKTKGSLVGSSLGFLKRGPDVKNAAKSGTPAMTSSRGPIPASIPTPVATTGTNDVSIGTVGDGSALEQGKEARTPVPSAATSEAPAASAPDPAAAAQQPLPVNQQPLKPKKQKKNKKTPQINAPAQTGTAPTPDAVKPDGVKQ